MVCWASLLKLLLLASGRLGPLVFGMAVCVCTWVGARALSVSGKVIIVWLCWWLVAAAATVEPSHLLPEETTGSLALVCWLSLL